MTRAFLLVLDSVGIGAAPDAARYGDEGSNTVGHIAKACASGDADVSGVHTGPLLLPNLARLGLGEACRLASGHIPAGLQSNATADAFYACAAELSAGKDTPSGHWEIAGAPVEEDWHYFPDSHPAFPLDLMERFCEEAGIPGTLGNCHASGTAILLIHGEEHRHSGKPICYTSADSVFQIAAHEQSFGLERLYEICTVARKLLDPLRVGRIIARPFVGDANSGYSRTGNRRDYTMPPPPNTILAKAARAGRDVISVGKIADIFAHCDTGRAVHAFGNAATMNSVLESFNTLDDGGLAFVNFNDFDTLFGHRRDVAGYAAALEAFDAALPELYARQTPGDLVIITADHGCDPTWRGTDHTREHIPIIAFGPHIPKGSGGVRNTFADIGATIARHLGLGLETGRPLWT